MPTVQGLAKCLVGKQKTTRYRLSMRCVDDRSHWEMYTSTRLGGVSPRESNFPRDEAAGDKSEDENADQDVFEGIAGDGSDGANLGEE